MRFFEIRVQIQRAKLLDRDQNVRNADAWADATRAALDAHADPVYAAYRVHNGGVWLLAAARAVAPDAAGVSAWLTRLQLNVRHVVIQETSLTKSVGFLKQANHLELIEDDDEMAEALHIDALGRVGFRAARFEELMPTHCRAHHYLMQQAQASVFDDQLPQELARINQSSKRRGLGHPVHYQLCTDSAKRAHDAAGWLVAALYSAHRLSSRRAVVLSLDGYMPPRKNVLRQLFTTACGGCIVLDAVRRPQKGADADDEGFRASGMDIVDAVLPTIQEFQDRVLVILHTPRVADDFTRYLLRKLGGMTIVTTREQPLASKAARAWLTRQAQAVQLAPTPELFADVQEAVTQDQLETIWLRWRRRQLKRVVYPQYAGLKALAPAAAEQTTAGSAYEELRQLIGLDAVKTQIDSVVATKRYENLLKLRGLPVQSAAQHLVFAGRPGTAKTTVARLFARILKENQILSVGNLIEVGRADLVGKYVGSTAPKVKAAFEAAKGSVLFIDEAYSLTRKDQGGYGQEAVDTIVAEMENHRDSTLVIFAGYPEEMNTFLAANPGLRSRVSACIDFPDYSDAELLAIARVLATKRHLHLAAGVDARLRLLLKQLRALHPADFGNGRAVRNLLEQAQQRLALRLQDADVESVSDAALTTLEIGDFQLSTQGFGSDETKRIGFCTR